MVVEATTKSGKRNCVNPSDLVEALNDPNLCNIFFVGRFAIYGDHCRFNYHAQPVTRMNIYRTGDSYHIEFDNGSVAHFRHNGKWRYESYGVPSHKRFEPEEFSEDDKKVVKGHLYDEDTEQGMAKNRLEVIFS